MVQKIFSEVITMLSERSVGMPMSPAHAAQAKNVSRRTIMRAIEALELKAIRDNRNHWKIDPQDLDKWADTQCAPSEHAHPTLPTMPIPDLEAKLAVAEAQRDAAREQLAGVQEDRDRWRNMAEKLTDKPRRSWWWR
jgi:excisionase family DNA binding protein